MQTSDTYRFIQNLKESTEIYQPHEYLNAELPASLIVYIKNNYKGVISSLFKKTVTDFGNDFIGRDGIGSNFEANKGVDNCAEEYKHKLFYLPIFWQEIVVLIYIALCLHRYVTSNSRVIALGESPLKLVFIQQVLNTMPQLNNILKENGMAIDIDYTYFPISGLSDYVNSHKHEWTSNNIFDTVIAPFELDGFIENLQYIKTRYISDGKILLAYFTGFKLDPRSIITSDKKIYLEDRMEGYSTLITLICFYDGMCEMQQLTDADRLKFYKNLYIIGFDHKDVSKKESDKIVIDRLNNFLYQMITKRKEPVLQKDYHFIQTNFNDITNTIDSCVQDNFNILSNQHNILHKIMFFLTLPEKTLNDSRCVKSCHIGSCTEGILSDITTTRKFHLKQDSPDGDNCNIMNLCLMIFINELGPEYISNIIQNLDNITEDIFINTMDFSEINTEISNGSNEQRKKYNRNILNNVLNTKIMIEQMRIKIEQYLESHGVFVPCTYVLPIKKRSSSKSPKSQKSPNKRSTSSSTSGP